MKFRCEMMLKFNIILRSLIVGRGCCVTSRHNLINELAERSELLEKGERCHTHVAFVTVVY